MIRQKYRGADSVNKTRSTKKQENSALDFGDDYLTNHLVKFRQDKIKPSIVGTLRVCIGYHFFKGWMEWVGDEGGWRGAKKSPLLPKICHTYNTMMKVGTVIPYPKKIQKLYESCDTSFYFIL